MSTSRAVPLPLKEEAVVQPYPQPDVTLSTWVAPRFELSFLEQPYAALGMKPEQVRMAVVQLFDQHQRVKYFRGGWKQPLGLSARGIRDGSAGQQFDEGGEATVSEGCGLFFPGGLQYEGQHGSAESLSTVWNGGKSSRLYEAFTQHWKTKKTQGALEKLVRAAASDSVGADLSGLALVTGVAGS